MIQDNQGVVWLGTEEGLFRYDGIGYKRYVLQDSTQWHVSALGYRESSGLWVGMASGEIYFVNARDEVVPWLPEEGLPNQSITGILEDSTGRLWFSTYGEGVYVYDKDRLYNLNVQDGLIENQIYCMSLDALGQIWLGTDNGVSICRFEDRKKYVRNLNVTNGLLDEIVY